MPFLPAGGEWGPSSIPCTRKPATKVQVCDLLDTAHEHGWPNLLMAHTQDSVTMVCLLCELHKVASLWRLAMETVVEGGKKKVLFCPFCQYVGSNDISYLNHIVIAHYNANYGCGKCFKLVFKSGQQLKALKKVYKGFKKKANKPVEKLASSGMNTVNPSYSTPKKKKLTTTSMLPDSQMSSQTLPSLQTSLRMSMHCHPRDKEKAKVATPEKLCSSGKDAKEKCDKHDKLSGKDKEKVHKSKHHKNKK